jgi:enoyl-CoA hydratase/carnithine racemase
MAPSNIVTERTNGVTLITLDDPPTRNALSPDMGIALYEEFDRFEADSAARVLVLTGADPAFCSGANVRRFNEAIEERATGTGGAEEDTGFGSVSNIPLRVNQIAKPTIAAVNGYAIGVGLGLALSCDIRLASDKAEFAEAFVRMGLVPGDGSTWQLPRLIGLSNTYLLQYTGDRIDAAEALRMNLVSKVFPHDAMMNATMELAERLAHGATYAMSLTKELVQRSMGLGLEESLRLAQAAQDQARGSHDHKEAVQAFLEKRKPEFEGR